MQRISRRSMLLSSVFGAAAIGCAGAARPKGVEQSQLTGEILFVGNRPELLPTRGGEALSANHSVICSLDLATGQQAAYGVPLANASSVVGLRDGRLICVGPGDRCLILRRIDTPEREINAPDGYEFTGCMWVDPNENHLTLGVARNAPPVGDGQLWRVSLDDYRNVDTAGSGGRWPIAFDHHPASNELVVLNAEDIGAQSFTRTGLRHSATACTVVALDAKTLQPTRTVTVESALGRPATLLVLPNQQALVGVSQYQRFPVSGDDGQIPALTARMSYAMLFDGYAPMAQPLLCVALSGAPELRRILEGECQHEALAYNEVSMTAVATFSNSDRVLFLDSEGRSSLVDASEFGLTNVAGACSLTGTSYLALAGRNRYVAIVDTGSKAVVKRYRTENYGSKLLTFRGRA